jgi:cobalt-zinc-cadmium efflux system membrane fusion protein
MEPTRESINGRWGKVLLWGLLGVALLATLAVLFVFLPGWEHARGDDRKEGTIPEEPARPIRLGNDTLLVPPEVVQSLGIRTRAAEAATRKRPLPPLGGILALDTNRMVRIRSRFPGEVVELGHKDPDDKKSPPLRQWDRVKENQLLAVVWSKDLGALKSDLVDAISRLRLDREKLERLRELYSHGGTAEQSVRDAERAVESDEISLARAERTLRSYRLTEKEIAAIRAEAERLGRKTGEGRPQTPEDWARVEVRAPQGGVILEKNTVSVGDLIDTSTDLFKIADLDRLNLWVHVYEEDLPALGKLLPIECTIRVPGRPEVFRGKLEQVGKVVDPTQHTVLVSGQVENPGGELVVGQTVAATVEVAPAEGEVEVPTTALVEDGRQSIVFVQPGPEPKFVRRVVSVTRRFHDVAYLRSYPQERSGDKAQSIQPGERIVTSGAVLLNEALTNLPLETSPER